MKILENLNYKDTIKFEKEIANKRVKCECGHTITFTNTRSDRVLCNWCGKFVYKNKQLEFKYKMKSLLNKKEINEN